MVTIRLTRRGGKKTPFYHVVVTDSRKRRIAAGAGVQLPEVNRLLKQFDQMQKTMKKLAKGGMLKNMMRGMAGRLPP